MAYGKINAEVARLVPKCAERVNAAVYFKAIRCDTYQEAYKKLLRIAHLLPFPLVLPWKQTEGHKEKFLDTTGRYSKGRTDPMYLGHRATQASCIVDKFSEDTP